MLRLSASATTQQPLVLDKWIHETVTNEKKWR